MAGLVQGVQYVLSSHGYFHENKLLIFVRLTDSAYRAIEDFLRKKYDCTSGCRYSCTPDDGRVRRPKHVE